MHINLSLIIKLRTECILSLPEFFHGANNIEKEEEKKQGLDLDSLV